MTPLRRAALAALVAVAAALPAGRARAQLLSPGELAQAHASIEGDDHCADCHSSGKRVDDGKCQGCHTDVRARVQAGAGLHGATYRGQECSKCHLEHNGRKARLVRWPGGDMTKLDHAQAGWRLEGAHARLDCKKCHDKRNARGAATFLGLSQACKSCHRDPHEGRFGPTCLDCHISQSDWKELKVGAFDHDKARFPLRGKHEVVNCQKCHGKPARYAGLKFASCADCHPDPHAGKFKGECASCHVEEDWHRLGGKFRGSHPGVSLGGGHAGVACKKCHDRGDEKAPTKGPDCVDCHRPVHEAAFGRNCKPCHRAIRWQGLPRAVGLEAHGKTPYRLEGMHADLDCTLCHQPADPPQRRYRELVFDRCTGCHKDRHSGEFAARQGGDCASCHAVSGYLPTRFGTDEHATTKFPLVGTHEAAPCGGCHQGKRPRLDLRVPGQACADCHANPHGGQFAAELAQGGCGKCHAPIGWRNPKIDHSTWPLAGAHLTTPCSGCHDPSEADRARGQGATYRGAPRACEGCHADVHAGQFRLTEPARRCDGCHTTRVFALPGFDHEKTAGWAIEGKHVGLACARCHAREKLRSGIEAVRWRLGYRRCRDCHASPHRE